MTEFTTIDRQGRKVVVKQLSDIKWLFVFQDRYLERREIELVGQK